ncbi:hypothetical protein BCV69DRAFT_129863 [Microstroma glucosiphilum]|uniref:Uncharacterized protein n=1 Tax=Pseudomicrostroma glucosiphilum TaxID=1684307 RepID=A0A316TZE9_9BASI|nr:hypothetical protein BCV69DRAFT_129863 [Pseudomicrostroma glucosiphilum]PWN17701.1 hypothetical protein BCV69DRAFT_129863 [Pseudomicrostroma glucosiphilum]
MGERQSRKQRCGYCLIDLGRAPFHESISERPGCPPCRPKRIQSSYMLFPLCVPSVERDSRTLVILSCPSSCDLSGALLGGRAALVAALKGPKPLQRETPCESLASAQRGTVWQAEEIKMGPFSRVTLDDMFGAGARRDTRSDYIREPELPQRSF